MLKRLGSDWGGWTIDTDLIGQNDYILSGGIANDTTFEEKLNELKPCNFVGIDPNPQAAGHIRNLKEPLKSRYSFIGKALSNYNSSYSTCDGIECQSIAINDLLDKYNFSLLKLDIEGGEYEVIQSIRDYKNVKQVAVEFHHWVKSYNKTIAQTFLAIKQIQEAGFSFVFHKVNEPHRKIQECLFVRKDLTVMPEIRVESLI